MRSLPCLFLAFISTERLPVRTPAFGEYKQQTRSCLDSSAETAGPLRVYSRASTALAEHHQDLCQLLEATQGTPRMGHLPPREPVANLPLTSTGTRGDC